MKSIIAWGVYYCPTKEGKLFAGLKPELQAAFESQLDAIALCDDLNIGGALDEMHTGYKVYSMQWLPKGFTLT